jgi:putative copper export protein
MWWPLPTRGTTPSQFLVFVVAVAVVLLAVGVFLVYLSVGQPPEKMELAAQSRSLGVKVIVGSIVVGTLAWLAQRFIA